MRKLQFKKMGKIAAVSVMSAIISISFNGCSFGLSGECNGEGAVTTREQMQIGTNFDYVMVKGECKNGLKEGLWRYYDEGNGELIQKITFTNGIQNSATKIGRNGVEYYSNGKKVGEKKRENYSLYFYLYEEGSKYITRYRVYDIGTSNLRAEYDKKVREIKAKNSQIEEENKEMQWEANEKYEEAKAQAQEIAKQRAESKVKKPTMQEVKKSKSVMDTYRAKLQAQVEKELQIELSKIPNQQVQLKQTIEIPQYKEPKLDTYEEILAFVKDRKYTFTEKFDGGCKAIISQDSDGKKFTGEIGVLSGDRPYPQLLTCDIKNNSYRGASCVLIKSNCRWVLEESMFKDKLNAILPND